MSNNRAGIMIFLGGVLMVGVAFGVGSTIRTDVEALGMEKYMADSGFRGVVKFFLFAFGFPLGLGVSAIGALYQGGGERRDATLFVLLTLVVASAAILVPTVFGRQLGGVFFGFGGTAITLLFLFSIWSWGKCRARLPVSARRAADLQAAGYFCFAIAAWNLCGVGGMPSFLLSPDKALSLGSHEFAVGQMKSVMALLLAGWLLTALGFYQAAREKNATKGGNA